MSYAYLFPGQGSQSIGMLEELAGQYPKIKQIFEQASEILKQDLWELASTGPEEDLNRTENTQPIIICEQWYGHKKDGEEQEHLSFDKPRLPPSMILSVILMVSTAG